MPTGHPDPASRVDTQVQVSQPSTPCPFGAASMRLGMGSTCVCSVLLWHWCGAHRLVRIQYPARYTRLLRPQLLGSSLPQVIVHQLIGRSRWVPGSQSLPQPALGPPSAPFTKPCRACVRADSRMSELLIHVVEHTAFPTAHTLGHVLGTPPSTRQQSRWPGQWGHNAWDSGMWPWEASGRPTPLRHHMPEELALGQPMAT